MFSNYFKIAIRNLWKNKVYSGINILGLALGMAVAILIGLWLYSELSFNHQFKERDRIAQVYQTQTFNGNTGTGNAMPLPLSPILKEEYGRYFEQISMSSWTSSTYLRHDGESFSMEGNYMEPAAIDMLEMQLLQGGRKPLDEPESIMLSKTAAETLFGKQNPIGQIIKVGSKYDMKVTAVYEDFPKNSSFFEVDFLMPWDFYTNSQEWVRGAKDNWGNNSFQLFVKIADNTSMQEVEAAIRNIKKDRSEDTRQYNPQFHLLPMNDWHLRNQYENGVQAGGRIEYVRLIGIIGFIVLILACINFMNLSTARSEKRAMEVGIRKTLGSSRRRVVLQFLSESFFIVCFAFALAIILVLLSMDGFNTLTAKEVEFPWQEAGFWLASLGFILITALLAGSYPALYLSSFRPIQVLKGTFRIGKGAALPRKILVVTQFTISIGLIIGTLIIYQQIQHSKSRPRGYSSANVIEIPTHNSDFDGKYDLMRDQFIKSGAVEEMGGTSSPITNVWSNRSGYIWEGKEEGFQEDFAWIEVTPEYADVFELEFIDGRNFSKAFASDSNAIILNKTAVGYMGFTDPVGKVIREEVDPNYEGEPEAPRTIVGVVKDVIMQSPYEPVKQTWFVFNKYGNINYYILRLNRNQSTAESLAKVEEVFKKHFPHLPFEYNFIDENYAKKFAAEERVAKLSGVFTVLAIVISCLGLFGLTSYVAEQRTREIGIRKTLGASVQSLWLLISRDFIQLVGISLLIAFPVAFLMLNNWLEKFPYRTDISWMVFLVAALSALVITLLTVSFQTVKSALANPVKSLRAE